MDNLTSQHYSWTTCPDGSVIPPDIKVFVGQEEGVYEIEFSKDYEGIMISYDYSGQNIIVRSLNNTNESASTVKAIVDVGDLLVSINNHVVFDEDIEDVYTFINVLREIRTPRRYRLLKPRKCSLSKYLARQASRQKAEKDMFGFARTSEYLIAEKKCKLSKMKVWAQRDMEWIQYLKSIGGPENLKPAGVFQPCPELKALVRRGIPVAFRSVIWPNISLSTLVRRRFPPNYYSSLLTESEKLEDKIHEDIEKDLGRTFPDHGYFNRPNSDGTNCLRRVLCAYAVHHPEVGYCQSLNFVAGLMLLFMGEEEAFWLLATVVEDLLPPDYFTRSMFGAHVDQSVLAFIVRSRLPKLHKTLELAQLDLRLISLQWCLCIFVNTLPPESALRIWDIFLNEGVKTLFRVSLALLKLNERTLTAATDSSGLFSQMVGIGRDMHDCDRLIATAYRDPGTRCTSSPHRRGDSKGYVRRSVRHYGSVPTELVGFGLAHLGPKSSRSPNSVQQQQDADLDLGCCPVPFGDLTVDTPVDRVFAGDGRPMPVESRVTVTRIVKGGKQRRIFELRNFYRDFSMADVEVWREACRAELVANDARFRSDVPSLRPSCIPAESRADDGNLPAVRSTKGCQERVVSGGASIVASCLSE